MKKLVVLLAAATLPLGACASTNNDTLATVGTGAAIGAAGGAGVAAVTGGSLLTGAAIGAAVGGLSGAVWADRNNDGRADGYVYQGQYYEGEPTGYAAARECRSVGGTALRTGAAGAAVGAGAGALIGGLGVLEGAAIGAAVGGLGGAVWADANNDGCVDGYVREGQYYQGGAQRSAYDNHHQLPWRAWLIAKWYSMTKLTSTALGRVMLAIGGGALLAIGAPLPAFAQDSSSELSRKIADRSKELRSVYSARDFRPLWLAPGGQATSAVVTLLERVETAELDAIDRKTIGKLKTKDVRRALRRAAAGDADDVAQADTELSQLFVDYVKAMRAVRSADGMIYANDALAPSASPTSDILAAAVRAGSLDQYIGKMGWMHPLYRPLRDAMAAPGYSGAERETIWRNLDRVRAIPAQTNGRHVLVDTAGARLWMYENGVPVDSMKVVVGKPDMQTPTMAGYLRDAIVNPYWNIPVDLVQQNIATNVLARGLSYLKERGYEVLSDYSERPAVLDPKTIEWKAVAQGTRFVRVRQKPGNSNFMGKAKFEFPNELGIYLHDTPDKHLLKKEQRHLSAGCVRLEDADRFGRWLLGKPLPKVGKQAEQRISAPQPVAIYITHLTALPTESGIVFRPETYRGGVQLANTAY